MSSYRPDPYRRHLTAVVVIFTMLLAGIVVFVSRQAADPVPAEAKPGVTPRADHAVGLTLRGQWFGSWRSASGRGFCIDFDRSDPDTKGSHPLKGKVPGMNAEESARVNFVANKYGMTTSKIDAAAAAIFIWQTQNTQRFDRYYASLLKKKAVPAGVRKRLSQITAEARLHGPYKLTMSMGAGYVGQNIDGAVVVRTSSGAAVPNANVTITHNANGKLLRRVRRTDKTGRMTFQSQVVGSGAVRAAAKLVTPAASGVWITEPSAHGQRLVLAGKATQTATARATSQKSLQAPSLSSSCSADCHGVAPVVVTMTNPCGSATLREYVYSNGTLVTGGTFPIPGCQTVTKTFNLPDAAVVTTSSCYLNAGGNCVSAPTDTGSRLTVVCPPWVEYSYTGACPCTTGKNLTYSVWVPASAQRVYTVTLRQSGSGGPNVQTLTLLGGQKLNFKPVSFVKDQQVSLSFSVPGTSHQLDQMTTNF